MNKIQLLDKYPVYAYELSKTDTDCAMADDVVAHLRDQIQAHPTAALIAIFDHLTHVKAQPDGNVAEVLLEGRGKRPLSVGLLPLRFRERMSAPGRLLSVSRVGRRGRPGARASGSFVPAGVPAQYLHSLDLLRCV